MKSKIPKTVYIIKYGKYETPEHKQQVNSITELGTIIKDMVKDGYTKFEIKPVHS